MFCVHLFAVADFFDLAELRTDTLRALLRYLDGILLLCSSNSFCNAHAEHLDLDGLCEAVRAAYEQDCNWPDGTGSPIQGSFVSLFWVIGTKLVERDEISTLLGDCHPFTVDLVKTMAAGACHIENPWLLPSMDGRKKPCEKGRAVPPSLLLCKKARSLANKHVKKPLMVHCSRCDRKLDSKRNAMFYNSVDQCHSEQEWCMGCAWKMIEDNTFPWRPQNSA